LEQERLLHRGAGLDAGLFISYGTSAEVIKIDDEVWGSQRVSISERINEAARGTARNMATYRLLEDSLAAARNERTNPHLEFPFRVFIADTRSFSLEPEAAILWNKAIDDHDQDQLARFLDTLKEQVIRQFGEANQEDQGTARMTITDIYNLGEAMSAGGLDAYLQQTRNTHFFFRIQVRTDELHSEFRDRFFFPDDMLGLIVGRRLSTVETDVEVFRYVGQVLFRGFEVNRPTPVYEILRPDSLFVRLLQKHHLNEWQAEAFQNPECKLESLINISSASEATI
jgi:hypothetical protein